jgi:SAM-dependent methyltransferase
MLIVVIILIFVKWVRNTRSIVEGFDATNQQPKKEFIVKKENDIYDEFYVSVYDDLVHNYGKNHFEIGEITKIEPPTDMSSLLDVGSGTGHHVDAFNKKGIKAIGIDISKAMVEKAKENYPDSEFKQGDVMDTMLFNSGSFSHITCLYFTIYYMKDKMRFFTNCMQWLIPGGFLILHLVDRENFDPILPAGTATSIISPQKYADKRITNTVVKFDKYDYKCNFDLNGDIAILHETFKDTTNESVRQNEHKLYMDSQKKILTMAKEAGFILHSKVDMIRCQYESQYLYILQKPH